MINLSLLHPTQLVPVQHWSFESESLIRIGRASDNDVILYSAVVSRHHVELWKDPSGWIIINFGSNGTYVDDEPIIQAALVDGMIIRLGNSGPKLEILTGEVTPKFVGKNQDLFEKDLRVINENNTAKTKGENYIINQGITQTEFE